MRRHLLALGDDLVGSDPQRRAGDHRRARAVRADAERDPVGVAVDVLHLVRIDAEPLVEHLLEHGLVPLALVLAAHQQGDVAARVKADFGEFLARRRPPSRSGWRCPMPRNLPRRLALVAPRREPVPIGERQRLFLVGREIAAVVIERQRRLVRDLLARDQVLRPQFDPVQAEFARRVVDQPLDDIGRLGPSGAAIGGGAVGVRHHRQHRDMRRRDVIDAGQGADIAERREQVALRRDIGADIGQGPDPERQKPCRPHPAPARRR